MALRQLVPSVIAFIYCDISIARRLRRGKLPSATRAGQMIA